jgi:hypothetical protein
MRCGISVAYSSMLRGEIGGVLGDIDRDLVQAVAAGGDQLDVGL